ncbi:MAG: HAD family hydrolase [Armatimonadetes bacterium]|nr:HAD family hydrolase [Armatimonadota bacterium]
MDIEDIIQSKKVLIFDLDNTLCNHDESVELARREGYFHGERLAALSGGGTLEDRNALREHVKRVLNAPPEPILSDQTGKASSPETWMELLKPLGIDNRMAAVRAATTYERRRMEELKPLPETRKFLEIVRRSQRIYFLIEGPPSYQRQALRRMRMDEGVTGIFYEEELGLHRPDPELFRKLLELTKARPDEAVFAGDDLQRDIPGAKAAGMFTIWRKPSKDATRSPSDPVPDFEVNSFLELFPRLERRMGGER